MSQAVRIDSHWLCVICLNHLSIAMTTASRLQCNLAERTEAASHRIFLVNDAAGFMLAGYFA